MESEVNGSCMLCLAHGPGANHSSLAAESPSAGVTTALASVLIFTIVVDILGNLLVILSVFRNKKLRNAGNIFVVSLSVADLVVAVYPFPLALVAIFHNDWIMGDMHCQISGFIMGLSVIGSIFNITAIAINRYCYICHSLQYDRLYSIKNTCCYLGLTWLLTALATVPNFFVGSLQYDPRIFSCTFAQTVSSYYTISVVVIHFIVPLLVVSFCYLRIWVLVIQVKHRVKPDTKQKITPSDLRNFLTMFVVFVLFAVCWGPLNFIGLAVAINPERVAPNIPEWLFITSYFMAYFNSCLNAIIYGLLNQNFRKEYKRILLALCAPRTLFMDTSKCGTEDKKQTQMLKEENNLLHLEINTAVNGWIKAEGREVALQEQVDTTDTMLIIENHSGEGGTSQGNSLNTDAKFKTVEQWTPSEFF